MNIDYITCVCSWYKSRSDWLILRHYSPLMLSGRLLTFRKLYTNPFIYPERLVFTGESQTSALTYWRLSFVQYGKVEVGDFPVKASLSFNKLYLIFLWDSTSHGVVILRRIFKIGKCLTELLWHLIITRQSYWWGCCWPWTAQNKLIVIFIYFIYLFIYLSTGLVKLKRVLTWPTNHRYI